ncbi:Putative tail fiber protein (fragment) [Xenorhabdus bovienii str. oregonense]|uniref:Putative tail fiber protein n=1 Tax=Xenorhabdus bovienii str. oregonense TaxID=1398202 RepID=A0A077NQK9_XENBV
MYHGDHATDWFAKNLGLTETKKQAENAYPKTGGHIEGKVYADNDIEAKGWIGGKEVYKRTPNGKDWDLIYSRSESNERYALKRSHEMFSCGGVDVDATHEWAGVKLKNANGYYVQLSARPHDDAEMLTVFYRSGDGSGTKTHHYASLRKKSGQIALLSDVADNASIGISQSWQDVKSQRTGGMAYTNNTGRPIAVFVTSRKRETLHAIGIGAKVNGIQVAYDWCGSDGSQAILSAFFIVPTDAKYAVNAHLGSEGNFIESWVELR